MLRNGFEHIKEAAGRGTGPELALKCQTFRYKLILLIRISVKTPPTELKLEKRRYDRQCGNLTSNKKTDGSAFSRGAHP